MTETNRPSSPPPAHAPEKVAKAKAFCEALFQKLELPVSVDVRETPEAIGLSVLPAPEAEAEIGGALLEAIRKGLPYNEGHYGATSSMTAVLGRMATYSGKIVKWDDAVARGPCEAPGLADYNWDTKPPVVPNEKGAYPSAMPGQYEAYPEA